jgi:hypothetical protein
MCLRARVAMATIRAVSVQAAGAIVFAFITVGAVGVIAWVALAQCGSVSWPTSLAIGGVSGAVDAIGVCAGKGKTDQQDKGQQLQHCYNYPQDKSSTIY